MILEIDAGNTALKWRIVEQSGSVVLPTQRVLNSALGELESRVSSLDIDDVRISSVAGSQIQTELESWVEKRFRLKARFAQTQKRFSGLTVSYSDPSRLGVDRWLAMLAARQKRCGDVCVIDCGSAITADLVAADGKHLGGYIVPGIELMKRAVLGDTKQIKMSGKQMEGCVRWGANTDEAVNQGIYRMAVDFVQSILREFQSDREGGAVFLAGGDAEKLKSLLELDVKLELVLDSDLVLDGLAIALP